MRGLNERDCTWLLNGKKLFWFELEFWLKLDPVEGTVAGWALIAGWLICSGAGLLECERMIHPPRKLNTEAMVSHARKLFLTIFMIRAFLCCDSFRNSG
jgi:hypothetical protein